MEIFQDGAFPNLEYNLFQVNWCVLTLIKVKKKHETNDTNSENRHINCGT